MEFCIKPFITKYIKLQNSCGFLNVTLNLRDIAVVICVVHMFIWKILKVKSAHCLTYHGYFYIHPESDLQILSGDHVTSEPYLHRGCIHLDHI